MATDPCPIIPHGWIAAEQRQHIKDEDNAGGGGGGGGNGEGDSSNKDEVDYLIGQCWATKM